jgi:hypothetical protein
MSDDIVPVSKSEIARFDEMEEILRNKTLPDGYTVSETTEDIQARMFEQQLNASDDDELESVGTSSPWTSLLGIPVSINSIDWRPSDKKDGGGPPIFAVVNVTRGDTGDNLTVTCGSWGVWASLLNLAKRGLIPGAIRILEEGAETKESKNKPLRLVSTKREQDERRAAKVKERL